MYAVRVAQCRQRVLVLVLLAHLFSAQIAAEPRDTIAAAKTELLNLARDLSFSSLHREVGRIDFETGIVLPRSMKEGWSQEFDEGARSWVWATGMHSGIDFYLAEARDLEMSARCWPFDFPDAPLQAIRVEVNGIEVASFEMESQPREYSWRIPERLLTSGTNRLIFEYARSNSPKDVLGQSDRRSLSVAWDWLEIGTRPAPSLPRVESLEGSPVLNLPERTRVDSYFRLPPNADFRVDRVISTPKGSAASLILRLDAEDGAFAFVWELATSRVPQTIELRGSLQISETPMDEPDPIVRLSMYVQNHLEGIPLDDERRPGAGLILENARVLISEDSVPARSRSVSSIGSAVERPRPNVIIFLIDSLRAANIAGLGHPQGSTPRIDAFMKSATNFVNARANAPWTRPGVASVLTGLTPWQHRTNRVEDALPDAVETLAELLSAEGYATSAIITNGNVSRQFGFDQGFEFFESLPEDLNRREVHADSARLVEEGIDWLKSRPSDRPFFLYLHATDPHAPYAPPIARLERMRPKITNPDLMTLAFMRNLTKNRIPVEDGLARTLESLYDEEISHCDTEFGRLLDSLEEGLEILDDTLIVVTADHGEEFYEHGWWQHGKTLYDEQLRIPLIIRFPARTNSGESRSDVAQQIDILPTVLAAAGIDIPDNLIGRDLMEPPETPDQINALALLDKDHRHVESIVSRGFKLIDYVSYLGPEGERLPTQLFDLSRDPGEQHNLATHKPILTGYLRGLLRRLRSETTPIEGGGAFEMSPETEATLRALGYVE